MQNSTAQRTFQCNSRKDLTFLAQVGNWFDVGALKFALKVEIMINLFMASFDTKIIWGNSNLSDMINEGKMDVYIFIISSYMK